MLEILCLRFVQSVLDRALGAADKKAGQVKDPPGGTIDRKNEGDYRQ
jgi:hypothetical protein